MDSKSRKAVELLQSKDPLLRESAARVLARSGASDTERWLPQVLSDDSSQVRAVGSDALEQLGIEQRNRLMLELRGDAKITTLP